MSLWTALCCIFVMSIAPSSTTLLRLPEGRVHVFFSIGRRVLIGLCSFNRVETSAPGLSGHYWYIIFTTKRQQQQFFPFVDWQGSRTLLLQSAWLECHLFHKGSAMLIQKPLSFLLALINASFLHVFTIVGDPFGPPTFWISSFLQQRSNASTGLLDRASSND